jgi:hypothetical protein
VYIKTVSDYCPSPSLTRAFTLIVGEEEREGSEEGVRFCWIFHDARAIRVRVTIRKLAGGDQGRVLVMRTTS